jgi:hypothetical protein
VIEATSFLGTARTTKTRSLRLSLPVIYRGVSGDFEALRGERIGHDIGVLVAVIRPDF